MFASNEPIIHELHIAGVSAEYLVLDIETGNPPEENIQAAIEAKAPPAAITEADIEVEIKAQIAAWTPPKGWRDAEKIELKRAEAVDRIRQQVTQEAEKTEAKRAETEARIREKAALLDAAPIACIGLHTERDRLLFNAMPDADPVQVGSLVMNCGSESNMLAALAWHLDKFTSPETVLVGFNIKRFDLPKLRARYLHYRMPLPMVLRPRISGENQPCVDLMRMFLIYFTAERHGELMISLAEVARLLGLPNHKDLVDGARVPGLIEASEYTAVLTYCALDIAAENAMYRMMASQGA